MRHELWALTAFIGGLRHDKDTMKELVGRYGVVLEESSIYQEAVQIGVDRGRAEERVELTRKHVLSLARKRFGAAPASEAIIQGIADTARLERIFDRLLDATSWDDLLATP